MAYDRPDSRASDPFRTAPHTPSLGSEHTQLPPGAEPPSIRPVSGASYAGADDPLVPPTAPFLGAGVSRPSFADSTGTPAGSYRDAPYTPAGENRSFLAEDEAAPATLMTGEQREQQMAYRDDPAAAAVAERPFAARAAAGRGKRPLYKRPLCWVISAIVLLVVVAAVVVPILLVGKKHHGSGSSGGSKGKGSSNPGSPNGAISGGDGSTIVVDGGSSFTYKNQFGGIWYEDPNNPFANNAFPNSWTKPLNQSWDFASDTIYGVNLGGWFVLEPFITPNYYQTYNGSVDEWTLSTLMAADTSNGGLSQLETHYNTFITEEDFAQMAGAGLNWVRMPIPYWCIDIWNDEPFLAKTAWKYILRAMGWARKYGLRVNLDLHTIPGSQNGYNHSGRLGPINWLLGPMGVANAERALQYIRTIAEFISQPEYIDLIPMFGVVNEPLLGDIGIDALTRFYIQVHDTVRGITGIGKGAFISIHDGFQGTAPWVNFLHGSDRINMDTHPYFAFGGAMTDPFINGTGSGAGGVWPQKACQAWGGGIVQSQETFGITVAGEFSAGWNDCGLFLHGVGDQAPTFPGDCTQWTNWQAFTQEQKDGLNNFVSASMDSLGDWFFWTWKIGNSTSGDIEAPLWSYSLGLQNGWIPTDPRTSAGKCQFYEAPIARFNGSYQAYQTGGAGAGTIDATSLSTFGQWPPPTISGVTGIPMTDVPTYTATVAPNTLPMPTLTNGAGKTLSFSDDGWARATDTASGVTTVSGCSYPDPWTIGPTQTAVCTGAATAGMGSAAIASVPIAATPTPAPAVRR